jgi:hypothetical protein
MRVAVLVLLAACANATQTGDDAGQDGSNFGDSGAPPDVVKIPLDASADVAIDVFDAGCAQDAALGGIGMPAGSTASAPGSYNSTPAMVIDGDLGTVWNSGGFTGSITITFASPVTFDGVTLYVNALPTTSETYTVFGIQDVQTTQLAQSTQTAPQGGAALQTIAVANAAYDGLRIDVQGNASWVAINEIALATTYCP